jgi:O-antigen ligase
MLFGAGVGRYSTWYYGTKAIIAPAHNVYVEILLKLGVLGLVMYALLVFSFLRRMLRVRNKLPSGLVRACVEASIINFIAAHAYMTAYDFSLIILVFYGLGIAGAGLSTAEQDLLHDDRVANLPMRREWASQLAASVGRPDSSDSGVGRAWG